MFRMIAETQWKWSRGPVVLASVIAFSLPLLSMRAAAAADRADQYVRILEPWGVAFAIAASGLGLILAITAWSHDHRGRHVYALSLPVERWRYALMRFGAGLLFLAAPTLALLLGSIVAVALHVVPQGLHAYPVALALRFGLAALVSFALFFAVSSATQRTAGIVLGIIAGIVIAAYLSDLLRFRFETWEQLERLIFSPGGPLAVFIGRWTLIDV
jgi:hypothetical protein